MTAISDNRAMVAVTIVVVMAAITITVVLRVQCLEPIPILTTCHRTQWTLVQCEVTIHLETTHHQQPGFIAPEQVRHNSNYLHQFVAVFFFTQTSKTQNKA